MWNCSLRLLDSDDRRSYYPTLLQILKNTCCAHAAAHAHRHHTVPRLASLHLAEQCGRELRAGAAQRMPQRDCAAVHVYAFQVKPRHLNYRKGLRGEGLIEFDQINLLELE